MAFRASGPGAVDIPTSAPNAHTNPVYVEAYGQLDVNASYNVNENFSVAVEAINLLDETIRVHGRNVKQTLGVTQTGTRFMIGARYKFD